MKPEILSMYLTAASYYLVRLHVYASGVYVGLESSLLPTYTMLSQVTKCSETVIFQYLGGQSQLNLVRPLTSICPGLKLLARKVVMCTFQSGMIALASSLHRELYPSTCAVPGLYRVPLHSSHTHPTT